MQETTDRSVPGMREPSLKAGITMLYFGYWTTSKTTPMPTALTNAGDHRSERTRNARALVEGRNHNAVLRILDHVENHPHAIEPTNFRLLGKTHHILSKVELTRAISFGRVFSPTC